MIYDIENSDITKVTSGIIVHGCNAQGVMGSGVAKQLRAKYPTIFEDYLNGLHTMSEKKVSPLGQVIWSDIPGNASLTIANAITQEFYARDGKKYVSYDALDSAMARVASFARNEIIHIPYLIGAGLGGGNAGIIEEIISANTQNLVVNFHHWK